MFLAWNEMKYAKLRYLMVVSLMFLIAYLVFFLTGLAFGLAQANRTAVDKWEAQSILLAKDVNAKLNLSHILATEFDQVDAQEKASLRQSAAVVDHPSFSEKVGVTFFGIEKNQFLMPNVIEGTSIQKDNQVIVDESLIDEGQINIGDKLTITGTDTELEIVGITNHAQLSVSPVVYMNVTTFAKVQNATPSQDSEIPINAIVVRGQDVDYDKDKLELLSIEDFINDLPGYSAQNLTFIFMIGFLIVIAAIVVGIFMYILTMQKQHIFGVMKVEGISTGFIAWSVIAQTFLLAMSGVVLGLLLTYLTATFLPEAIPFSMNHWFNLIISALMISFALLGAVFSVGAIAKIDPLDAIE